MIALNNIRGIRELICVEETMKPSLTLYYPHGELIFNFFNSKAAKFKHENGKAP
jgi:hypothetical protein